MARWDDIRKEREERLRADHNIFHKIVLWWTAPIIRGWVVVLYVGFFASLGYVWDDGVSTDNRIISAQKDGREQACELARKDNEEDRKNVATQVAQYNRSVQFLKDEPDNPLAPAVRANLPNLRQDIKQAKTGIDAVPDFCDDPDLGLPTS